jgi:hypothetical protein
MYDSENPLPMRFPATNPPTAGDHIDIGVWPGGWRFMRNADRERFEDLSEAEQAEQRRAFDLTAKALDER